jgi:hypothetical protein
MRSHPQLPPNPVNKILGVNHAKKKNYLCVGLFSLNGKIRGSCGRSVFGGGGLLADLAWAIVSAFGRV